MKKFEIETEKFSFGKKCCTGGCEGHTITLATNNEGTTLVDDLAGEIPIPHNAISKLIVALKSTLDEIEKRS